MKLSDINYERKAQFILLTYRTRAGDLIKKKYQGYNLCEAIRLFKTENENL